MVHQSIKTMTKTDQKPLHVASEWCVKYARTVNSPIKAPLPIKAPPLFSEGYPDSKFHFFYVYAILIPFIGFASCTFERKILILTSNAIELKWLRE